MSGLMHGTSARHIVESTRKSRSAGRRRRGGGGVPVTIRLIPEGETDGTVEARLKAEKLKQAEFLTNRLKAEDAARNGKYMDAQEAFGEACVTISAKNSGRDCNIGIRVTTILPG